MGNDEANERAKAMITRGKGKLTERLVMHNAWANAGKRGFRLVDIPEDGEQNAEPGLLIQGIWTGPLLSLVAYNISLQRLSLGPHPPTKKNLKTPTCC